MSRPTKAQMLCAICLICAVVIGAVATLFLSSAKYALIKTGMDLKNKGIEGLREHLTGDALDTFDAIETITEEETVSAIIALFAPNDSLRILKTYLPDLTWSIIDMDQTWDSATVTLDFTYKNFFRGELTAMLTKSEGGWYIYDFRISDLSKK